MDRKQEVIGILKFDLYSLGYLEDSDGKKIKYDRNTNKMINDLGEDIHVSDAQKFVEKLAEESVALEEKENKRISEIEEFFKDMIS